MGGGEEGGFGSGDIYPSRNYVGIKDHFSSISN